MNGDAHLRQELRPSGYTSAACKSCVFFERCGGLQNSRPLFNCFDQFCCGTGNCDHVCPYKSDDFERRLQEIGGFRCDDIPELLQEPLELPTYVPMIHHPSRRVESLSAAVVALDPYLIFRTRLGSYRSLVDSGDDLRRHFKVSSTAKIILRGTAEDRFLEQFWTNRRIDRVAEQMARLGVSLVIGPNYSQFLDVPRTDILFNRKRQLLCLAEFAQCGISVAPHLSAVMPADWAFWTDFLRSQPQLHYVALNLQTGNKDFTEGSKAIDRVQRIQEAIGRPLSLILIGGAQFLDLVTTRFSQFSLIDSEPFARTMRRKLFRPEGKKRVWLDSWSLVRQPIDHILQQNVDEYSSWVERRRKKPVALPSVN